MSGQSYSYSGMPIAHQHPQHSHAGPSHTHHGKRPTDGDMDKLRSTLKQFVRDWSEEVKERSCILRLSLIE